MEKHVHQAQYDEHGKLTELCSACGESFRNTDVHFTSAEWPKDSSEKKEED